MGYGGSFMLDYEDYLPEREIDIEWCCSHVRLETYNSTSDFVESHSDAVSTSLWARRRAPTGWSVMDSLLRHALEAAHITCFGEQIEVFGFSSLSSLGLGVEVDSSAYDRIVTRTRLVARYRYGDNVSGLAIGLAVSF